MRVLYILIPFKFFQESPLRSAVRHVKSTICRTQWVVLGIETRCWSPKGSGISSYIDHHTLSVVPTWACTQLSQERKNRWLFTQRFSAQAHLQGASSSFRRALARLLLHEVLVVDHAPTSALQNSVHVITIHIFRVTVHEHVFGGRPFQHGVGLCQNIAQPCHCKCQGFLSSIRRCVRRSLVVNIFGISHQSQRDRADSIQGTSLIHRIAQEVGKETTAENADICSFFGSLQLSRVGGSADPC